MVSVGRVGGSAFGRSPTKRPGMLDDLGPPETRAGLRERFWNPLNLRQPVLDPLGSRWEPECQDGAIIRVWHDTTSSPTGMRRGLTRSQRSLPTRTWD